MGLCLQEIAMSLSNAQDNSRPSAHCETRLSMWQLRDGHMSPFRLAAEGGAGNKYGHSLRAKQFPSLAGQWPSAQRSCDRPDCAGSWSHSLWRLWEVGGLLPRAGLYRAVGHQLCTEEEAAWPGAPRPSGWWDGERPRSPLRERCCSIQAGYTYLSKYIFNLHHI